MHYKPHFQCERERAEVWLRDADESVKANTYLLYLNNNNNNVGYRQKHNFK
jgi:hypothetical protein